MSKRGHEEMDNCPAQQGVARQCVDEQRGCQSCLNSKALVCLMKCPRCNKLVCNGEDDEGTEYLTVPTSCYMHICQFCDELIGCGSCELPSLCVYCGEKHCQSKECIETGCKPRRKKRVLKLDGVSSCASCSDPTIHTFVPCKLCQRDFCQGERDDSAVNEKALESCFVLYCIGCENQLGCKACAAPCKRCKLVIHCQEPTCKKLYCEILMCSEQLD